MTEAQEPDGRGRPDPFYRAVLFRTIRVAALCTAICVVLAFPMAYCLARTRTRFKNLLLMAVILLWKPQGLFKAG